MIRANLFELLKNEYDAVAFCMEHGLLTSERHCDLCGHLMTLDIGNKQFRCNKSANGKRCNKKVSLLKNTFFQSAKLSLRHILFIIYEWSVDTPRDKAAIECQCSAPVVGFWYRRLRNSSALWWYVNEEEAIGGEGNIVEIDETCIVRRKYHRGRALATEQQWMVGGIVRGCQEKCFVEFVNNRKRETLLEIVVRRVLPNTTIITDCWAGYKDLDLIFPEHHYLHLTVNHKRGFVNPETQADTQSIEGFWSVIKRRLRKQGTNRGSRSTVFMKIKEGLYKKKHKTRVFEKIIEDVANLF
jgi:hypothetical protein